MFRSLARELIIFQFILGEKAGDAGKDLAPGLEEGAAQIKKGIEAYERKDVKVLRK